MTPYQLVEFEELSSTNLYARENLRTLKDRDVIQARIQTAGRGRWQRAWVSDVPGNLCLSCVLKPESPDATRLPLANVSQLMALAACRVLEGYDLQPALKWPNDILISQKKIAGILAETVTEGTRLLGLVIGIGVNLNLHSEVLARVGQPAASLNLLKGHPIEVAPFRDALLSAFFASYDTFLKEGFSMIRGEFLRRFDYCGRQVTVKTGGQTIQGTVLTLNSEGALELCDAEGTVRVITLGEMFSA